MQLDLTSFAIKWQQTQLTEKSAYQQHFRDLCEALGVPHPTEEDIVGTNYTFEKHVTKVGGGSGFADVWKRDAFAWEYKLPGGDLKKAYKQLNEYHEDLENPPLLIVCDFKRFEVHTKFESQRTRVYAFDLEELRLDKPVPTSALLPKDVLKYVFGDRNKLRPEAVTERVTRDAATDLLKLAQQLEHERAATPTPHLKEEIANFLIRIVFCLFADSIGIIPNNVFRKLVVASLKSRVMFNTQLPQLFEAMSKENSYFGAEIIPWFNGGLFKGADTIELNTADCDVLRKAAKHDWSQIEPSIFGTLFERSLNAAKRSMIGAHYTSPEDILLLIEPVVMTPLRHEWASTKTVIEEALAAEEGQPQRRNLRANRPANRLLTEWAENLSKVRILDPACGSGNFLYIAMKQLLDLWQEAREWGSFRGLMLPVESMPTPAQLYGIELDFYAHEIASAVVWIGLLQWKRDHGYNDQPKPILEKLSNIQNKDAIMRYDEELKSEQHPNGTPYEPVWPPAEYIVGNPPFLHGSKLRRELGDGYVEDLFNLYRDRVAGAADLVCYWLEKGREQVVSKAAQRVGLIATQAIRGGASQKVLGRIEETASIFYAWSDRDWLLDGATVHVSFIGFDLGADKTRTLNGVSVDKIHRDLSAGVDATTAMSLSENLGIWAYGSQTKGSFDLNDDAAEKILRSLSPFGRDYRKVVKVGFNGKKLLDRKPRWVIDFGENMSEKEASLYEAPFQYVKEVVWKERRNRQESRQKSLWWLHARPSPKYRDILERQLRYLATAATSKHRVYVWLTPAVLVDHAIIVFARQDDYFMGVMQSRINEIWTRALGTQVREAESGFRYTPTTTFETFPFPFRLGAEPAESSSDVVSAIADAARELVHLRDAWLNPPNASDDDLKTRTLTKLYNARPEWLDNAHRTLDEAVFAAYGWPSNLTDQEILARLLALNHERAALTSTAKLN